MEKVYQNKETRHKYTMYADFKPITIDWNNDGDIYTLNVCILKAIDSDELKYLTREELADYYQAV